MNMRVHNTCRYKILQICISEDELDKGCVFSSGFSGRLASDNQKFREKKSSFPNSLIVVSRQISIEFSLNLSHQTR